MAKVWLRADRLRSPRRRALPWHRAAGRVSAHALGLGTEQSPAFAPLADTTDQTLLAASTSPLPDVGGRSVTAGNREGGSLRSAVWSAAERCRRPRTAHTQQQDRPESPKHVLPTALGPAHFTSRRRACHRRWPSRRRPPAPLSGAATSHRAAAPSWAPLRARRHTLSDSAAARQLSLAHVVLPSLHARHRSGRLGLVTALQSEGTVGRALPMPRPPRRWPWPSQASSSGRHA